MGSENGVSSIFDSLKQLNRVVIGPKIELTPFSLRERKKRPLVDKGKLLENFPTF
jgi:hypothetical protein